MSRATKTQNERLARVVDRIETIAARGDVDMLNLLSDVIEVLDAAPQTLRDDPNLLASALLSVVDERHPWLTERMTRHLPAFQAGYFAEVA